jgi:large subunit ribosomal protein L35
MPKMKTNRIASKKLSINKNGKIKRAHAFHSHNTAKKSAKRRRNLSTMTLVDKKDSKGIKRLLPYA